MRGKVIGTFLKKAMLVLMSIAVICAAGYYAGLLYHDYLLGPQGPTPSEGSAINKDRLNVLLLGNDARPGETFARADTIIVASLDFQNKRVAMLSIPRDTRVNIPGHGWHKINEALSIGQVDLLKKMIQDLIGVSVDRYALVNFEDFVKIVDTLGGVTLDVEKDMKYDTGDMVINLRQGTQHLNGEEALGYVRFRHDALGDISRTERQQKFLAAILRQSLRPSTLLKLPKLIPQIAQAVDTDLTVREMLSLSKFAAGASSVQIVSQTLPGNFMTINGGSYWYVDPKQAKEVAYALFYDGLSGQQIVREDLEPPSTWSSRPRSSTSSESKRPVPVKPKPAEPAKPNPKPETQSEQVSPKPPASDNGGDVSIGGEAPVPPVPDGSQDSPSPPPSSGGGSNGQTSTPSSEDSTPSAT